MGETSPERVQFVRMAALAGREPIAFCTESGAAPSLVGDTALPANLLRQNTVRKFERLLGGRRGFCLIGAWGHSSDPHLDGDRWPPVLWPGLMTPGVTTAVSLGTPKRRSFAQNKTFAGEQIRMLACADATGRVAVVNIMKPLVDATGTGAVTDRDVQDTEMVHTT